MKRSLLFVLALAFALSLVAPKGAMRAAENTCFVEWVSQNINQVVVKAHTGGPDGQLSWPNGGPITVNDGWSDQISLDYGANPRNVQVVNLSVPEVSCSGLTVFIHDWDPAPTPPPTEGDANEPDTDTTSPVVGNAAFVGHGVDDCRFFVDSGATYDRKTNVLVVWIQKMGEGSRPFTAYVSSTDGKVQWHVQSDPDLSGEGGVGADSYHLPFDEVLNDQTVKQVYVTIFNAITGAQCDGPLPVSIR